ncbi:MAG: hypothetical protein MR543_07620 [Robinsoniella sp.]|nr:hypothetical protein [Robinsoniella sp.]
MPGYIVHLTAAKFWLEQRKAEYSEEWMEKFLIGNLLPDAVEDKNETHFRDPATAGNRVQYPQLSKFLEATQSMERTPFWWGFYYHLYIDACFFQEYMPRLVTFLNREGKEEEKITQIVCAKVQKSGEYISQERYFSEEYYYGDFTKMNDILMERFDISFDWKYQKDLPEIWRARVERQLIQFKKFAENSKKISGDFRVFDLEDLILFLRQKAKR